MCLHCCIETITIDQVSSLCVHVRFKNCFLDGVCIEPSQCSILIDCLSEVLLALQLLPASVLSIIGCLSEV